MKKKVQFYTYALLQNSGIRLLTAEFLHHKI